MLLEPGRSPEVATLCSRLPGTAPPRPAHAPSKTHHVPAAPKHPPHKFRAPKQAVAAVSRCAAAQPEPQRTSQRQAAAGKNVCKPAQKRQAVAKQTGHVAKAPLTMRPVNHADQAMRHSFGTVVQDGHVASNASPAASRLSKSSGASAPVHFVDVPGALHKQAEDAADPLRARSVHQQGCARPARSSHELAAEVDEPDWLLQSPSDEQFDAHKRKAPELHLAELSAALQPSIACIPAAPARNRKQGKDAANIMNDAFVQSAPNQVALDADMEPVAATPQCRPDSEKDDGLDGSFAILDSPAKAPGQPDSDVLPSHAGKERALTQWTQTALAAHAACVGKRHAAPDQALPLQPLQRTGKVHATPANCPPPCKADVCTEKAPMVSGSDAVASHTSADKPLGNPVNLSAASAHEAHGAMTNSLGKGQQHTIEPETNESRNRQGSLLAKCRALTEQKSAAGGHSAVKRPASQGVWTKRKRSAT